LAYMHRPFPVEKVLAMRRLGLGYAVIARAFDCSSSHVRRICLENEIEQPARVDAIDGRSVPASRAS
jgi:hypothetical protein